MWHINWSQPCLPSSHCGLLRELGILLGFLRLLWWLLLLLLLLLLERLPLARLPRRLMWRVTTSVRQAEQEKVGLYIALSGACAYAALRLSMCMW